MQNIMSTSTLDGLQAQLSTLNVEIPIPSFDNTHVLVNPIDIYRSYLANILANFVERDRQLIYDSVQWTNNLVNGDLLLVIPKLRLNGAKPAEVAKDLSAKVRESLVHVLGMIVADVVCDYQFPQFPLFAPPIAAGIHFQVQFAPKTLPPLLLPYIFDRRTSYGQNLSLGLKEPKTTDRNRRKMIVEFSSPNIAKEFHAGHLRSTIIGAYLSNLYTDMGWDVIKVNYLGDWGKQFGLLAVGWHRFGSEALFKSNPLGHLLDVYVRINSVFKHEEKARDEAKERGEDAAQLESQGLFAERNAFFKRMEDQDPEAVALWKRFRDVSIERYISTYARLNIQFDDYSGESQVKAKTMQRVECILVERGVLVEDNNAQIIDFKKHGAPKLDIAIVRNRQGTSTYLLRDIAALIERDEKYHFDRMIYVVSAEQDIYFQRLFKAIELMGHPELAKKVQHVNFGKVLGMSSRMGNVRLLSDILNECGVAMHDVMRSNEAKYAQVEHPEAISDILGISAVMVQDMSGKRVNNYPFDMRRMTSFEGDTGPYLQYTHARLCSIMRKAEMDSVHLADADFSLLTEPHVIDTLRLMAQYPDVTQTAYKTLEPTTILTYLFKFSHQLSSGYDVVKVIGISNPQLSRARAAYYECARQVLNNGMRLLGISPVER